MKINRSEVPEYTNYEDYKEHLRIDFSYSCAYCTLSEMEARGISFEIDHYWEKSLFPDQETTYSNLMWACKRCNNGGKKLKFKRSGNLHDGKPRFIKIDVDDTDDHFYLNSFNLEHKTLIGEFTIDILDLNSKGLKKIRRERKEKGVNEKIIREGLRFLENYSLDKLPPRKRGTFLNIKKRLILEKNLLEKEFHLLLKSSLVNEASKIERQKRNLNLHKKWDPLFDSTDAS